MYIQIEGENIYYEKQGTGQKTFLLLHNAGGNHLFFYQQMEMLKKLGTVITLDLPGHGKSSAFQTEYSIHRYALFLIQFCDKFNVQKLNILGLNNGANIAIEIAHLKPELLENLGLIDPPLFMNENFIKEIQDFIQQLSLPTLDSFIAQLASQLFIKTDDKNKKIAEEAFKSASPKVLTSLFKDLILWNQTSEEKVRALSIPTLCILSDEHHCAYQKLRSVRPDIEIGKLIYSKCWATLEVPEQLNAMLQRFLAVAS